jgi:hypothetical protein
MKRVGKGPSVPRRPAATGRQRAMAEQIATGERLPAPPRRVLDLARPPKGNRPDWLAGAWALPKRDEAGLALFAEEYAAAERFWAWLADCYTQTADRLRRGYAYLTGEGQQDEEAFALYEALGRWADWCATAYWLLLRWYGAENSCARLRLPFPELHDGAGHRLTIVRELRGVPGELLLEDALWHWRAQLILTRRLTDVGEAPPPEPGGNDDGR